MVLRKYDTFFDTKANGWVGLNKDYVSTTTFDNNYLNEQYNSFILGNSRSMFFQVSDWKKQLDSGSNCYHFDAAGESLFALHKKVIYIDSKKVKIKNALLILDNAVLIQDNPRTGHLVSVTPKLVNNSNILSFHLAFLKAFGSPEFLCAYFDFKLSGKVKPYMKENCLLDDRSFNYDILSNEVSFDKFEKLIAEGKYYSQKRKESFFKRDLIQKYAPVAIKANQKKMLRIIFDIFSKHKTNYKVVISPIYDQIKINNNDLNYLVELFGRNKVFDFSGINCFTEDYNNYYENSHYRPHVAREILNSIYQKE
jgi:hypothetical protein